MLLEKYKPCTLNNVVGNKKNIENIKKWLSNWNNENKKNMLISGRNGIGKTLIIELLSKELNYKIIQYEDDLQINNYSYYKEKTLLLIDHLDDYSPSNIRYFINNINETQKIPFIFICNERYSQTIKPLISYCIDIKLETPKLTEIQTYVYNICVKEHIRISKDSLLSIIDDSNNDIRNILNNLCFYKNNNVDMKKDVSENNLFEITNKIFSQNVESDEKQTYYLLEPQIIQLMVQENYISNIIKGTNNDLSLSNIQKSSQSLSDMDILNKSWELEKYSFYMCNQCVSNCHSIKFPTFTKFLGNKSKHNKNKNYVIDIKNILYDYKINDYNIQNNCYFIVLLFHNILILKNTKNKNVKTKVEKHSKETKSSKNKKVLKQPQENTQSNELIKKQINNFELEKNKQTFEKMSSLLFNSDFYKNYNIKIK